MRFLIIGIDSMIGAALARRAAAIGHQIFGTSRRKGSNNLYLDLRDDTPSRFDPPEAEVVFFCAGIARFAECRMDTATAYQVNVAGPAAIARNLATRGCRPVMLSTSAVFEGSRPLMPASSPLAPKTVYGKLKAEAEERILNIGASASVIRFAKILPPGFELFEKWRKRLAMGEEVSAFHDVTVAPVLLQDAVDALLALADDAEHGIYQLSSMDDVDYVSAAQCIAKQISASPGLIRPVSGRSAGIPPSEMPAYSSLDSSRISHYMGRHPIKAMQSVTNYNDGGDADGRRRDGRIAPGTGVTGCS